MSVYLLVHTTLVHAQVEQGRQIHAHGRWSMPLGVKEKKKTIKVNVLQAYGKSVKTEQIDA